MSNKQHTLEIGTKREASAASVATLFRPIDGQTATTRSRYDKGKYATNLRGRSLEVPTDVVALWTERRTDRDGPYWALYCYAT